jgi:hypothetical protein
MDEIDKKVRVVKNKKGKRNKDGTRDGVLIPVYRCKTGSTLKQGQSGAGTAGRDWRDQGTKERGNDTGNYYAAVQPQHTRPRRTRSMHACMHPSTAQCTVHSDMHTRRQSFVFLSTVQAFFLLFSPIQFSLDLFPLRVLHMAPCTRAQEQRNGENRVEHSVGGEQASHDECVCPRHP